MASKWEIREEGYTFATIEAESAEEALEIAEKEYPRRAADYNGYTGPVTWRAWGQGESGPAAASRVVQVA